MSHWDELADTARATFLLCMRQGMKKDRQNEEIARALRTVSTGTVAEVNERIHEQCLSEEDQGEFVQLVLLGVHPIDAFDWLRQGNDAFAHPDMQDFQERRAEWLAGTNDYHPQVNRSNQ